MMDLDYIARNFKNLNLQAWVPHPVGLDFQRLRFDPDTAHVGPYTSATKPQFGPLK